MFEIIPYTRRNNVTSYNPFREMDAIERSFFNNFFGNTTLAEFRTDITDTGDAYLLEADLPGFAKEDIHLDVNGDVLTIRAERHSSHEDKNEQNQVIRCERSYGSYSRDFDVSGVNVDGVTAKYENGVLSLHMPKKHAAVSNSRTLMIQ